MGNRKHVRYWVAAEIIQNIEEIGEAVKAKLD